MSDSDESRGDLAELELSDDHLAKLVRSGPIRTIVDALRKAVSLGRRPDRATVLEPAAETLEREAKALGDAGDLAGAADLITRSIDVYRGRISLNAYYLATLGALGRHDEAKAFSQDIRREVGDNVWTWYWSIWAAAERGDWSDAEAQLEQAEALLGAPVELVLSRALLMDRRARSRELADLLAKSPDFAAAHPELSFNLAINAHLSLSDYAGGFAAWRRADRPRLPALTRLEAIWRLMAAPLIDPAASPTLSREIFHDGARELLDLGETDSLEVMVILLRRLAEVYYKDKGVYAIVRARLAESTTALNLFANPMGRALAFVVSPDAEAFATTRADLLRFVDLDEYAPAYFYLSHEWTDRTPEDFAVVLDVGATPQRAFAAYLFSMVYDRGALDDLLRPYRGPASEDTPLSAAQALTRFAAEGSRIRTAVARRVGAVGNRPLKIAVCISGQLRGFRAAKSTWSGLGLEAHDTRYFLHSWYDIGRKSPTAQNLDRCFGGEALAVATEFFNVYHLGDFTRRYPTLVAALAEAGEADEASLAAFYGAEIVRLENDREEPFRRLGNSEKMYRKIADAHALATDAGEAFDLIVRIRPDMELSPDARIDLRALHDRSAVEGVFFADRAPILHLEMGVVFGDQLAIGVPEVMDVYADTYRFIRTEGGVGYRTPRAFLPHTSLVWSCVNRGLKCEVAPGLGPTTLAGPDPLPPASILAAVEADLSGRESDTFDVRFLAACKTDAL